MFGSIWKRFIFGLINVLLLHPLFHPVKKFFFNIYSSLPKANKDNIMKQVEVFFTQLNQAIVFSNEKLFAIIGIYDKNRYST